MSKLLDIAENVIPKLQRASTIITQTCSYLEPRNNDMLHLYADTLLDLVYATDDYIREVRQALEQGVDAEFKARKAGRAS